MSKTSDQNDAYEKHRASISKEFYHWVAEARSLVEAHFPNESASAHNALIIETAKAMMLMHKLDLISFTVDDIRVALENPSWS
ncbi:MAG: hypothetical protein CSA68_02700 [Rhodobacterales bacterium]|nr:MAG: hypothetical protein CSA68_02700 [Rhodobacterales bacterium]